MQCQCVGYVTSYLEDTRDNVLEIIVIASHLVCVYARGIIARDILAIARLHFQRSRPATKNTMSSLSDTAAHVINNLLTFIM